MDRAPFFPEISEGPADGAAYWLRTCDDVRIRVGHWNAENPHSGTVLLFPGRTEYIELQGRTARDLNSRGYSVLTIDWRGHGLSDRTTSDPKTLHVNSYDDYQLDVAAMHKAAVELGLPQPWFLLGSSMGACIGLRAIIEELPVAACAFTAPMWGLQMGPLQKIFALPVALAACTIGKGHAYVPGHDGKHYASNNPFEGNRITFDPDGYAYWVRQALAKPELQTAGSSMRWLYQSLSECRRLAKLKSPSIPCLAFWGHQDSTVDYSAISNRIDAWPNGTLETFEGAKHGLMLEKPAVRTQLLDQVGIYFSKTG